MLGCVFTRSYLRTGISEYSEAGPPWLVFSFNCSIAIDKGLDSGSTLRRVHSEVLCRAGDSR